MRVGFFILGLPAGNEPYGAATIDSSEPEAHFTTQVWKMHGLGSGANAKHSDRIAKPDAFRSCSARAAGQHHTTDTVVQEKVGMHFAMGLNLK